MTAERFDSLLLSKPMANYLSLVTMTVKQITQTIQNIHISILFSATTPYNLSQID